MALVTGCIGKKTRASLAKRSGGNKRGLRLSFSPDLYIIQINGFSALMDDAHKMIAGREFGGTPHKVVSLLVEAIGLIVNENGHRSETPPALVAQKEPFPTKTKECFTPNAIRGMYSAFVLVHS